MSAWIELITGPWINLDLIEAVVPLEDGACRFYPPRAQRGGRPTGRPTPPVKGYDDDRGFWEGTPVDPQALRGALTGLWTAPSTWAHPDTPKTAHSPQGGSHEPQRPRPTNQGPNDGHRDHHPHGHAPADPDEDPRLTDLGRALGVRRPTDPGQDPDGTF